MPVSHEKSDMNRTGESSGGGGAAYGGTYMTAKYEERVRSWRISRPHLLSSPPSANRTEPHPLWIIWTESWRSRESLELVVVYSG